MSDSVVQASKRLSWLLRHGAGESGLSMDEAGWCEIRDVLSLLDMTKRQLEQVVATNDKGRLVIDAERIRACQGHSALNMPVTSEALEDSWERLLPVVPIWHGTRVVAIPGIVEHGLLPGRRTHVHLAESSDSRVGKRTGIDLMLEVSPAKLADFSLKIFRSQNGVILVRSVPLAAITDLRSTSARARREEEAMRRLLKLPA